MKTFVELNKLNILAIDSFSLSTILLKLQAKNNKNRYIWPFKRDNSYKESSDNFEPMETFVELFILNKEGDFRFFLPIILFEI